jgi:CHAD domain-containing protein
MTAHVSHYLLTDGVTPERLREALQPRFDVDVEPARVVDHAYLDTFDGLVHHAGLALAWQAGRLVLSDDRQREIAAADWPRPPAELRIADLPAGELRERLRTVIDVRAASALARVRVRRRPLRVLDAQRKTVVRMAIEAPTVADAPPGRRQLAVRLSVDGVRGYDRALEQVRRVIEDELGLPAAGESLADEAVASAGGTPGGVSSKVDIDLDGAQHADTAAVAILTRLTQVIDANLPGTLADVDSEFLHDLRVAVRRTRALQRELKGVFPADELRRFRAGFRWLQEITGPTRDLDVHLLEFDHFASALPATQRDDLEPLRVLLTERRDQERRRMVRALRSQRARKLLGDWQRFVAGLADLPEGERPDAARPIREIAAGRIATVYRQMVRMGDGIDDHSPPTALHDLRKKGKELRYLLEFFAALFAAETVRPMVKTLKSLQDTLGRFQDREVQAATLRTLSPDIATRPGGPEALMAMGVLVEQLAAQQAEARDEFAQRFAPFAAKARRKAVKESFR